MSNAYYYFVASLPTIEFDKKPILSLDQFISDAERILENNDFVMLKNVLLEQDGKVRQTSSVYKSWVKFNRDFRNELTFYRAKNANKDPQKYLRGERSSDSAWGEIIQQAIKASDPLAAEKILDQIRWRTLDDLVWGQYFNIEFLIVYGLKLKMLERYQLIMNSPEGQERLKHYQKVDLPDNIFV